MRAQESFYGVFVAENRKIPERFYEEFSKFTVAIEELQFLRLVAQDLKSFRKMLRFRRYD
ncbi:MAG: hypothetical protein N3F10_07975 [Candidatus Bathyarchaeota archaeon]|nr:hypothetical protein [Candidatus Bathyarchaeota archaeon]MDW8040622.1 hypothetical protein [Nitrososphaerota archaeon]